MDKAKALELITLLSALESWAFSLNTPLPEYLHDRLADNVDDLAKIILGDN